MIPEKGQSMVTDFCDAEVWPDELPPSRAILLERVRGIEGLLCLLTDRIDGEVMDAAGPGLKVISNHAVGVDNIDLPAATRRGIPVGNTPGILTNATADFAFALILAAARRVVEGERFVRDGRWKTWGPSLLLGTDVFGATLGIIGYGRIGQALAKRASGFEMRILYYDPSLESPNPYLPGKPVGFETLLGEADFVSLHTPLTEETHHLIDDYALALMKPSAVLINTSRGPVVDPQALYRALKQRRIFAAALDVTDPEPISVDSPLLDLDNLTVVPHIASASRTTREKMATMAAENLIAGLKGERLPNCANPEVYASA
ncbi:MAG: D-glycerate dehydrogenase [Chloroflexi bacterium RBG_16_57_11]|nr:MAG: D-glycerate dehydrogenase [Chloroflexi bacterium RBG_16_57_11]